MHLALAGKRVDYYYHTRFCYWGCRQPGNGDQAEASADWNMQKEVLMKYVKVRAMDIQAGDMHALLACSDTCHCVEVTSQHETPDGPFFFTCLHL